MFEWVKAKQLGLKEDLGKAPPETTKIGKETKAVRNPIHDCGTWLRLGRTENDKIVHWCPKCKMIILF